VPVVDMPCREFGGRAQGIVLVLDAVVLLVAGLEPRRMSTVSCTEGSVMSIFWKRPRQGMVLLEDPAISL